MEGGEAGCDGRAAEFCPFTELEFICGLLWTFCGAVETWLPGMGSTGASLSSGEKLQGPSFLGRNDQQRGEQRASGRRTAEMMVMVALRVD